MMNKFKNTVKFFVLLGMFCVGNNLNSVESSVSLPKQEKSQVEKAITEKTAQFVPPEGWRFAESSALPKNILLMVVGQGGREFPPSINLATDNYKGSLKEYLKVVKSINDAHGDEWKDLGTIRTEAGEASLSQLDTKMNWGSVRMMQVILLKEGTVYILTAAALKDEFPKFYKDFFKSMRSLQIK